MAKRSLLKLVPSADPRGGEPTRTLIERAYLAIREDIIEGRLAPGEKLRVEHLRQRYDVGAGTLREAISRLVTDALVHAEGQRGFRVAPVSLADLDDLTNLRVQVETEALRLSIRRRDAAWEHMLRSVYDELSALEQPLVPSARPQWEQANVRFHEALIAGCRSPRTFGLLRSLARHGERYRRYVIHLPRSERDVHAEHRDIFNAAVCGQEARAALALEAHIRTTPDLLHAAHRDGADVFRMIDARVPTQAA